MSPPNNPYAPQPPSGAPPPGVPPVVQPTPDNPYAAPGVAQPYAPVPAAYLPSTAPRVLGILSIVFSGLNILGCGAIGAAALNDYLEAERGEKIVRATDHAMDGVLGLNFVIIAVIAVGLLVVGIGQTGFRRWAVNTTRAWALLALTALAAGIALGAAKLPMDIALGWGFVALFIWGPFPIVLLAMFSRERVTSVMNR